MNGYDSKNFEKGEGTCVMRKGVSAIHLQSSHSRPRTYKDYVQDPDASNNLNRRLRQSDHLIDLTQERKVQQPCNPLSGRQSDETDQTLDAE